MKPNWSTIFAQLVPFPLPGPPNTNTTFTFFANSDNDDNDNNDNDGNDGDGDGDDNDVTLICIIGPATRKESTIRIESHTTVGNDDSSSC
jgi:hypothetical protein